MYLGVLIYHDVTVHVPDYGLGLTRVGFAVEPLVMSLAM